MHILLTGASGSTAGNLLRMGAFRGARITTISRSGRIDKGGFPTEDLVGDLASEPLDKFLPLPPDLIVHAAAVVPKKASGPEDFQQNLLIAENVASYAFKYLLKHLVVISTGSVYGSRADSPIESTACFPDDEYGHSMYAAEEKFQSIRHRVPLTLLRLFYPYGFDALTPPDNLVAKLWLRVVNEMPLSIGDKADQSPFRPVFMEDVSRLVNWLVREKWLGTLNVAGPQEITLREMLEKMASLAGKEVEIGVKEGMPVPANAGIFLLKSLFLDFSFKTFDEGLPIAVNRISLPEDE